MLPDITKKTEDKIRKTIEEKNLIQNGQHIVIGLSGGPDSVCLFNALMSIAGKMQLTIYPVHVNHKLRPDAAEHDQKYVEELCRRNGLECESFVVDCNALAAETGMTSEEAGRKARYDAFYVVAEKISTQSQVSPDNIKIAVAHNANDQAETVLFRLMRGTGIDGLAGIAYEREERGYKVIRPLLDVYRDEIEEYCRYNHLEPVIDHTNSEAIYARNKIRNELIPYLEREYNGNIQKSMKRLAGIAAADKDYMWRQAEREYAKLADVHIAKLTEDAKNEVVRTSELASDVTDLSHQKPSGSAAGRHNPESADSISMDRASLAALHPAIRHRVILKAFAAIGLESDISEERIKAADSIIGKKQGPKSVQFPHGYVLEVAKGRTIMKKL